MNKRELTKKIKEIIALKEESLRMLKEALTNPNVRKVYDNYSSQLGVFQDILAALQGNPAYLNIHAIKY